MQTAKFYFWEMRAAVSAWYTDMIRSFRHSDSRSSKVDGKTVKSGSSQNTQKLMIAEQSQKFLDDYNRELKSLKAASDAGKEASRKILMMHSMRSNDDVVEDDVRTRDGVVSDKEDDDDKEEFVPVVGKLKAAK